MENFNLKQTGVEVQELLDAIPDKADKATTLEGYGITDAYTKAEDDALLETKADKSDTYTKEQADGLLDTKADNGTTLADYGITDAYTKDEVDDLLDEKADKATTLAGYGIGDAYTKQEVNNLITTPDQQYVTVEATDQTTSATDVLPATGEPDTIYRVGNWDGTQYDPTNYSEYAWDGTQYVLLDTKDFTLATASDFDNPTAAQQAKIPTVGAILDCMDTTPTAGSVKPVQSGGVYEQLTWNQDVSLSEFDIYPKAINSEGLWGTSTKYHHIAIPVLEGEKYRIKANSTESTFYAFLKDHNIVTDQSSLVNGSVRFSVEAGGVDECEIPHGCLYLYILIDYDLTVDVIYKPESMKRVGLVNTDTLVKCKQKLSAQEKQDVRDNLSIVDPLDEIETPSDLEFSDEQGHVIVRFDSGHVCTKHFDSTKVLKINKRVYARRTGFTQEVNTTNFLATSFEAQSLNTYEQQSLYLDNCVLYLPSTYTTDGEPTKLIIFCKQGASVIEPDGDTILSALNTARVFRYMLYLGYGILAADGVPNGWAAALGIGERAVGNYVAVQSIIRAFDFVKIHYNIDSEHTFIWGYSQGGHTAQNIIDNSNLPIAAAAELSPVCSMRYHQWDLNVTTIVGGITFTKGGRLNIARIFNFPTVSSNEELLALQYDESKTIGYDPWTRNVENMFTGFEKNASDLWKLPSGMSIDSITMKKHVRCPVKVWAAENDDILSADVMKVFVKAIKNSGQVADLQLFSTGGHSIPTNQTSIGTFVENGSEVQLYPIAKDVAAWFYNFGGYALKD